MSEDKTTAASNECKIAARDAIDDALHAIHQNMPTIALRCLERAIIAMKEWESK